MSIRDTWAGLDQNLPEPKTLMDLYGSNHTHENDKKIVLSCPECQRLAKERYSSLAAGTTQPNTVR